MVGLDMPSSSRKADNRDKEKWVGLESWCKEGGIGEGRNPPEKTGRYDR
jgi:hypothetical protein